MQVCISLKTDNHASTPPLSFLQAGCPSCRPTNSVKALKAKRPGYETENKKNLSRYRHTCTYRTVCYIWITKVLVENMHRGEEIKQKVFATFILSRMRRFDVCTCEIKYSNCGKNHLFILFHIYFTLARSQSAIK